jgi:tRNA pseudouridine55 synthase
MDGVLVIDKPDGPTSHDVVARARRALGVRQVGHTGTLDPMATGVLALVVGRATRLAQFLAGREKRYLAEIRLGIVTDSWDRTGAVLRQADHDAPLPGRAEVEAALRAFLGPHDQVPPPYSAKKVGGVPSYELARRGRAIAIAPARVTLHAATVEAFAPPIVRVGLTCSAGFYVRALADTLGARLGCGACLETLRRTASGSFGLEDAVPLARLEDSPAAALERLIPPERTLPDFPAVTLTDEGVKRALHGNDVRRSDVLDPGSGTRIEARGWRSSTGEGGGSPPEAAFVRLLWPDGRLLAVARPSPEAGVLHPAVVLG